MKRPRCTVMVRKRQSGMSDLIRQCSQPAASGRSKCGVHLAADRRNQTCRVCDDTGLIDCGIINGARIWVRCRNPDCKLSVKRGKKGRIGKT